MCDVCGCPELEPFRTLVDDHEALLMLADAYERSGDEADLEALRVVWEDHRRTERVALEGLAGALGMREELSLGAETDEALERVLALAAPDGAALRRTMSDHADAYEYDAFPHLVFAADDRDLEAAAERVDGLRAVV